MVQKNSFFVQGNKPSFVQYATAPSAFEYPLCTEHSLEIQNNKKRVWMRKMTHCCHGTWLQWEMASKQITETTPNAEKKGKLMQDESD